MRLKIHLILGFFCLILSSINAQTPACQPDTLRYRDSASGVYPRPYQDTVPWGGINKAACIGKPYQFVFTLKVSDSIDIKFATFNTRIPLDSGVIAPTGAVAGLPTGIGYACNPPNCSFKKKTMGCLVLTGTPTSANTVKDYKPIITGKFYSASLALLGANPYTVTFPGDIFPGDYTLKLYAANDSRCTTAAKDLNEVSDMSATPNPTNGRTTIRIESAITDKFEFSVTDLLGRRIIEHPLSIQAGQNTFDLDVTNLPNGVYIYSLTKGSRVLSDKLIINQ